MKINIPAYLALGLAAARAVVGTQLLEVHLGTLFDGTDPELFHRVWYGDGVAYVGPTIPSGVETALNISVKSTHGDWLLVELDSESHPDPTRGLLNPTFMVGKVGSQSGQPFYFAHSAVGFTEGDVYMFLVDASAQWYPRSPDDDDAAEGDTYLIPTETEGTYTIQWFADADEAEALGGQAATISTWR